jgi:hypothetical protein
MKHKFNTNKSADFADVRRLILPELNLRKSASSADNK